MPIRSLSMQAKKSMQIDKLLKNQYCPWQREEVTKSVRREMIQVFWYRDTILAIASLVSRVIGLVYRIPLTAIIGDHGNDYYSCALSSIYSLLLLISSYSLPMAVSKMVSARISNGERQNAYRVFKGAMLFAAITGTIARVVVFFGAEELTRLFQTPLGVYALAEYWHRR